MRQTLIVTFFVLALLGASDAPSSSHTIVIRISQRAQIANAHVFLGVAVLGHHVGWLDDGWLVKQAGPGILHIDWIKSGTWDGLRRTVQGPRDVSQAQLGAVVHTIESLGFAPSEIRAWRVPAPVGYDGFNEGDTVLTIGEILVDLGPMNAAPAALERWWKIILSKDDPFDKIPLTNVRYSQEFFVQPDCDAVMAAAREDAIARSSAVASSIARDQKVAATFASYEFSPGEQLLCPQGREPNFMSANGGPPIRIYPGAFDEQQISTVTYAIDGLPNQPALRTAASEVPQSVARYAFDLPEPYIATQAAAGTVSEATAYCRQDAQTVARIFHVRVGALVAARVTVDSAFTVEAAWALQGVQLPAHPLVSAAYTPDGQASGLGPPALASVARQAYIDNPSIVSAYETGDQTLVVQR